MGKIFATFEPASHLVDYGPSGSRWGVTAEWVRRAFLALVMVSAAFLVAVLGSLLALSCDSCSGGIGNSRFVHAVIVLGWVGCR
ncbi:hypothetical protein ABZ840_00090 [Streptomyces sp. NPDC047117]|uniref:hypothetical protein n=1 Tax=Streptomyces sp. NPDC047117 TaxID=3155379 RepID=UPI0033E3CBF7